jgi:hypothetical protein
MIFFSWLLSFASVDPCTNLRISGVRCRNENELTMLDHLLQSFIRSMRQYEAARRPPQLRNPGMNVLATLRHHVRHNNAETQTELRLRSDSPTPYVLDDPVLHQELTELPSNNVAHSHAPPNMSTPILKGSPAQQARSLVSFILSKFQHKRHFALHPPRTTPTLTREHARSTASSSAPGRSSQRTGTGSTRGGGRATPFARTRASRTRAASGSSSKRASRSCRS